MAANGNPNWKPEKLEDICVQITDGKHGDCQDEQGSGFYFLSCKDVAEGKLNYEGARQITEADFLDTHRRTKLAPFDILITNSGTIGRMAIAPENELTRRTTFQKSVAILKPIVGRIEPNFLYYGLQGDVSRLIEFSGGTAQKNLLLRDLRAFELNVPLLSVQRRIAGILSTYDELIENSQRRIRILETMARSLYREWFVDFRFPNQGRMEHRAHWTSGQIPKGWRVAALKDVTTKIGSGATPRGGKEAYQESGVSLIRSLNIYDYEFEFSNLAFIDDEQAAQLNNVTVEPRDVLLNITGASVARCSMVPSHLLPARVNQHVAIVRSNPVSMDPYYLLDSINNDHNKQKLLALAHGGATREALTKDTISNFPIVVPPPEFVFRYGGIAGPMHVQRETLSCQVQNLRRTRDLLLPRLLSGQVNLKTD